MKEQYRRLITPMVVVGVCLSCTRHDDPGAFLRQEAAELQTRTVPPSSEVLVLQGPTQYGSSKTIRWEFDTSWDWTQYKEWVTSKLQPDFGVRRAGESRLVFVKSLEADTEETDIEESSIGVRLHVKITLTIYPN